MKNKFDISSFVNTRTMQAVTFDLTNRVKQRRKEKGLSQKDLSVCSGVSYASIRKFETTGEISLTSLLKISEAIGCLEDFDKLFNEPIIVSVKDYKIYE